VANYASAVVSYADALNAVTFPNVPRNKIVDQVFDTSPFYALLRGAKHIREVRGGLFHQRTINVGKSPNFVWYAGSGGWKMQTFEGLIAFGWDWKFAHDGVVISGDQIIKNEYSDDAIVDLIQGKIDIAEMTGPDQMAQDLYRNVPGGTNTDGTAGNPNAWEGLAVQVDNGTISATVGQQSRTTYSILNSKVNYNSAIGAGMMAALQALWLAANRGGLSRTKLNLVTEAIYGSMWGQLQTPERYTIDPARLEALGIKTTGGNDLGFNDSVILLDEKVPTGVQKPVQAGGSGGYWYGLNTDFFELAVHPDRFYSIGEWFKDPDGDSYFIDIYFAGALIGLRPNRQFVAWMSGG